MANLSLSLSLVHAIAFSFIFDPQKNIFFWKESIFFSFLKRKKGIQKKNELDDLASERDTNSYESALSKSLLNFGYLYCQIN